MKKALLLVSVFMLAANPGKRTEMQRMIQRAGLVPVLMAVFLMLWPSVLSATFVYEAGIREEVCGIPATLPEVRVKLTEGQSNEDVDGGSSRVDAVHAVGGVRWSFA